jgi:predicted DNA-binding transcriptional regulator YafY
MPKADRLLALIQILRRHRHPVSGQVLAEELGVSLRTLYRDVAALQGQGATIDGEPGVGYLLRPGFLLPPLMFSEEEIEAIALGAQWVARRADKPLAAAARDALAKIAAVLPADLREGLEGESVLVGPGAPIASGPIELSVIRQAIRVERKLDIRYRDASGEETQRMIWPISLAFFDQVRVLAAWCETRAAFRHFRADRISDLIDTNLRYPRRRRVLMKEWRAMLAASNPDRN